MTDIPSLYKLLLYLPIQGNLALVDTLLSNDRDELIQVASDRKANNSEYAAVLLSYELTSANIVEG